MEPTSPIIFIGMHRSGTSLLGRLLEKVGLFTGSRKDRHNEAIFFREINEWLMWQCGARWDSPQATNYLWQNEKLLDLTEEYIRYLLKSPRAARFLGWRRYLSTRGIQYLDTPWGWKDPRNTFTLPLWLRIFPQARVLYIERHGVDVAQSLKTRGEKKFIAATQKYQRCQKIYPIRPKRSGFLASPRCASLENGFALWQEHMDQAAEMLRQLPEHRIHRIRYESLLEDPATHLSTCSHFCNLETSHKDIAGIIQVINSNRAYAYLRNPTLKKFADMNQLELAARGYA